MATLDRRGLSVNPTLGIKAPCRVATTANIALNGLQTIDGVALAAGDRVLVWFQTDATENGPYNASSGNWTRCRDADSNEEWASGCLVMVTAGATYNATLFRAVVTDPVDLGESDVDFVVHDFAADRTMNLFDIVPEAMWPGVLAFTSSDDLYGYVNTALAILKARGGGKLKVPYGRINLSQKVSATTLRNVIIEGEGGQNLAYNGLSGTVFRYTGAGAGSIFELRDHRGLWLRDFQVTWESNSFTGTVFDLSCSFSTGCASGLERVQYYQTVNTGHNAAAGFYYKNCVDLTFRNIYASHSTYGWVAIFAGETGDVNMIKVEGSTSIALKTAAFANPIVGHTISEHNFEPSDTGAPCGIITSGVFDVIDLALMNPKCADSTANGTWFNFANNTFNFKMIGGDILALSGTTTGINFGGTFHDQPLIAGVFMSGITTGINYNSGAASVIGACVHNLSFLAGTTPIANMANCDDSSSFFSNSPNTANRALKANYGGTGQLGGYTAGDILYASGPGTLVKLGVGAARTFLKGGALPAYSAITADELSPVKFLHATQTVNFNSANTDTAFTITLPPGYTRWGLQAVNISGANGTLTTATFGVFTGAGGTGTQLVATGTACTVSTASEDTANNLQSPAVINNSNQSHNQTTIYFRVQTPQGAARTATVEISYTPVS